MQSEGQKVKGREPLRHSVPMRMAYVYSDKDIHVDGAASKIFS